mgnify:FL=1
MYVLQIDGKRTEKNMELNKALVSVLNGNKEDFRFIIHEYIGVVRSFLASRLFDGSMVDDLAQEVFIAVYEQLRQYKTDLPFKSWVLGIAHNKIKMHYRSMGSRKSAYERFLEVLEKNVIDLEPAESDMSSKLNKCMENLSERMKQFLQFKYIDKMKAIDIAKENDMQEDAVNALLYRTRKKLADCMGYAN